MSPLRGLVLALVALLLGPAAEGAGPAGKGPAPRRDLYGDPLPEGAVARLGSLQFRHAGMTADYVFQGGGKTVLTAGSDRALRFWDVATGRQVRAVKLQTAGPALGHPLTLSPDGKRFAAVEKGELVVWEVDSGKELQRSPLPKASLAFLLFSPDGKSLATAFWTWRVVLRDVATGTERVMAYPGRRFGTDSTFHGHFSPDGKWFIVGGGSASPLCVFEAATGREAHRLDCNASTSAVSPDNKRLAVCSMNNDKGGREAVLRLFDLGTGKQVSQFPLGHEHVYFSLAFSPDGKALACGSSDRSCVVDTASGRVLYKLSERPIAVSFTPDGKSLAASTGQRLRFWDAATGKERHDRPGEFSHTPALAVSPDGRLLAAAGWLDRAVSLWDARSGRLLRQLPMEGGEGRYVRNLTFSADGRTLAAARFQGAIHFWDVATGKERRTLQLQDPDRTDKRFVYFFQLHVTPDARRVVTLERMIRPTLSTRLAVWDGATGKLMSQNQHSLPNEVRDCAWSADGSTGALSLPDGLTVMETDSGVVRFHVAGTVTGAPAASPDDRLLATRRFEDGKPTQVGVWEAATGKEVATVATGPVAHLALAADDRSLVTTDAGSLRVWDLATGKERRRWPLPVAVREPSGGSFVQRLLLSPDGRRAFTPLADGTCLVWDLSPARPAEPLVRRPGAKELAGWWADLGGEDAGRAYAAVWRLSETPAGVAFLRERVKPVSDADLKKARRLIAELDSDAFEARENASKQLEGLGGAALPALREARAAKPSPEVRRRVEALLARVRQSAPPPEALRRLRAVLVLEQVASPEARAALAELAAGAPYAAVTREAKAALGRLSRRAAAP